MYFAHSTDDQSQSNWQPLAKHLRDVAALAEQFGAELGLAKPARFAGLLHDLGKYSLRFQARLSGGTGRSSTAGTAIAAQRATGDDRVIAELVAYAIAGHHAGLPDMQGESLSPTASKASTPRQSTPSGSAR